MEVRGSPRRLYCFTYGWEPIPEVRSRKGGAEDRFLLEPVTGGAVVFDEGWVLIDTGFNPELIRDPVKRAENYVNPSYIGVIPPGDPLVDQVAVGRAWNGHSSRFASCHTFTAITPAACGSSPTDLRLFSSSLNSILRCTKRPCRTRTSDRLRAR